MNAIRCGFLALPPLIGSNKQIKIPIKNEFKSAQKRSHNSFPLWNLVCLFVIPGIGPNYDQGGSKTGPNSSRGIPEGGGVLYNHSGKINKQKEKAAPGQEPEVSFCGGPLSWCYLIWTHFCCEVGQLSNVAWRSTRI